jgi:hypothetical protein
MVLPPDDGGLRESTSRALAVAAGGGMLSREK